MKKIIAFCFICLSLFLVSCSNENYPDEINLLDYLNYESCSITKKIETNSSTIDSTIQYDEKSIHYYETTDNIVTYDSYVIVSNNSSYVYFQGKNNYFYNFEAQNEITYNDNSWYKLELTNNEITTIFSDYGAWNNPSIKGFEIYKKYFLLTYFLINPEKSLSNTINYYNDIVLGSNKWEEYDYSKTLLENLLIDYNEELTFAKTKTNIFTNNAYKLSSYYDSELDKVIVNKTEDIYAKRELTLKNNEVKKFNISYIDNSYINALNVDINITKLNTNISLPVDENSVIVL